MELDLFKQAPQLSAHFEAAQWPSRHVFFHGAVTILSTMEQGAHENREDNM
jgi:hypothetical protein